MVDRGEARELRAWLIGLAALAAVRAAIPLAALVASGRQLPGFPPYRYHGLPGDANGYVDVARALISAGAGLRLLLVPLLGASLAAVISMRWAWRRYPRGRHWVLAAAVAWVSLVAAAVILRLPTPSGTGAVGWPLVLSVPLLPFRAIGWIDEEVAFGAGLALSILANAVTVFAIFFIGLFATGSRRIGLTAAALFATWPLLTSLLLGAQSWENSAWEHETGLALYSEPLSTACVAAGLALALIKARPPWALVAAGVALGYATTVRPTNVVFGAAAALLLASQQDWRSVLRLLVGAVTVLPIAVAFLPKKRGYDLELVRDETGDPLWSNDYVLTSFLDSSVWQPLLLALLLPLVAIAVVTMRDRGVALMLLGGALANAAIYAFFRATFEHPRYLHAGLPALLVLWAAGGRWLTRRGLEARQARVRSS